MSCTQILFWRTRSMKWRCQSVVNFLIWTFLKQSRKTVFPCWGVEKVSPNFNLLDFGFPNIFQLSLLVWILVLSINMNESEHFLFSEKKDAPKIFQNAQEDQLIIFNPVLCSLYFWIEACIFSFWYGKLYIFCRSIVVRIVSGKLFVRIFVVALLKHPCLHDKVETK